MRHNRFVVLMLSAAALSFGLTVSACADEQQFEAPRVDKSYLDALAKLPDWNGNWIMTGGINDRVRIMFDPDHVFTPQDKGEGLDFGTLPGAYNTNIPYKPEYQKQYMDIVQATIEGKSPDPLGACMQPHGMPRQMAGIPMGAEIHIAPEMVLLNWAFLGAQRRIYTDGREHPDPDIFPADYMGHSIGHWEGDTLVVDTVGMIAGIYDMSGAPFSDQIHVKERIRLVQKDVLEDEITIEDPEMLTAPWKVIRRYQRANPRYPDLSVEYCQPGSAVDFSKGYQELILPSELEERAQKQ